MRILLISTPVGPLGSGMGGGVELTLHHVAVEMMRRSHSVQVLAPVGSHSPDFPIIEVQGTLHSYAQYAGRTTPVQIPNESVLSHAMEFAREKESEYDVIANFAYHWLPFYLASFFKKPIAHFVSMASLNDAMDSIVRQVGHMNRNTLGACTQAQAQTFAGSADCFRILGFGIDVRQYKFQAKAERQLAWIGRIAPEKGLEDAAAISQELDMEIHIMGKMQDSSYWNRCEKDYPRAKLKYLGFHPTEKLQALLGSCQGLLMTHKLDEAFGIGAIEALACGVPVIAYDRGGPREIVQNSKTGFLVRPDSLEGMVEAVGALPQLDRRACRLQAEQQFTIEAYGDRVEAWFNEIS